MRYNTIHIRKLGNSTKFSTYAYHCNVNEGIPHPAGFYHCPISKSIEQGFNELKAKMIKANQNTINSLKKDIAALERLQAPTLKTTEHRENKIVKITSPYGLTWLDVLAGYRSTL